MNHLLAHFSDIVARMLQDLAKERSGERKKNERRCYARLCEKADSLEAPGSVARFLRNRKFYLINDKLEETRTAYHLLVESLTDADWHRKTSSTAWTVEEVMTHLADTLVDKPAAIADVRRGKNHLNLPPFLNWLAHPINRWLVKWSARRQTRQTILARYDQAYSALLATLDGIKDHEWKLGAFCYGEGYKTILEVCQMVVSHFQEHAAQIAVRK